MQKTKTKARPHPRLPLPSPHPSSPHPHPSSPHPHPSSPFPADHPPPPPPMHTFGADLSVLEDGQTETFRLVVDANTTSVVFASRNRGSMPLPLGCSAISVPTDIRCPDGYWFAALFQSPQPITKPDPTMLFRCIAGFLPHLAEHAITITGISPTCFQVEGEQYKLAIQNCTMKYNSTKPDFVGFRGELAALLPVEHRRFRHALLNVADIKRLPMHPAHWSVDEGMHFITDYVAIVGTKTTFPRLEELFRGRNWTSSMDRRVLDDVNGEGPWWGKMKKNGMNPPRYDDSNGGNMSRYLRNKWVHFYQLDQSLREVFKDSRHGLVRYCDLLLDGKDFIFSLWEEVNKAGLMTDYKVELLQPGISVLPVPEGPAGSRVGHGPRSWVDVAQHGKVRRHPH